MAVSIGKRKRRKDEDDTDHTSEDEGAMRALFQRAFEAKFKPLENTRTTISEPEPEIEIDDENGDEDSDWSGLLSDEEQIKTVQYDAALTERNDLQRQERKAFMSSKPPTSEKESGTSLKLHEEATEDDPSEVANKKHDLALQRLLKESHLLDPSSFKTTASNPQGKGRVKALGLRMKDLGAKNGDLQQQKMPLSHRKGITAKANDREDRRRRDALENGVVLEKAKAVSRAAKHRDKGIGGPAIGKFRGGTLKLRQRDVRSMEDVDRRKRRR